MDPYATDTHTGGGIAFFLGASGMIALVIWIVVRTNKRRAAESQANWEATQERIRRLPRPQCLCRWDGQRWAPPTTYQQVWVRDPNALLGAAGHGRYETRRERPLVRWCSQGHDLWG